MYTLFYAQFNICNLGLYELMFSLGESIHLFLIKLKVALLSVAVTILFLNIFRYVFNLAYYY